MVIDGKAHAAKIRDNVKKADIKNCKLAVVLVGDNPASLTYINVKKLACEEVGFQFLLKHLPESSTIEDVSRVIIYLNNDKTVTGILVQQPMPIHLDKYKVVSLVDPRKDVDCLHPYNVGLAFAEQGTLRPCTPAGIMTLLKNENISLKGKHAVIIGRSEIVGKPLAFMFLAEDATVTTCHSQTQNLPEICRQADILVVAAGSPEFIKKDMVKPGAVIIDVGINRLQDRLCGDVDFNECEAVASYITPVPGGVGPMTVATLMENCLKAWSLQNE